MQNVESIKYVFGTTILLMLQIVRQVSPMILQLAAQCMCRKARVRDSFPFQSARLARFKVDKGHCDCKKTSIWPYKAAMDTVVGWTCAILSSGYVII